MLVVTTYKEGSCKRCHWHLMIIDFRRELGSGSVFSLLSLGTTTLVLIDDTAESIVPALIENCAGMQGRKY